MYRSQVFGTSWLAFQAIDEFAKKLTPSNKGGKACIKGNTETISTSSKGNLSLQLITS